MEDMDTQSNTDNPAQVKKGKKIWGLGLIIPLMVVLPLWFFFIGPQLRHDRLVEKGIKAQGRLISVDETGTVVNDSPELELVVEFTLKDGARHTASTDFVPSRRSLHLFQPDVAVTVAYDPEDPDEITIVDLSTAPPAAVTTIPQVSTAASSRATDSIMRVSDSLKKALETMEARLRRLEEGSKK